VSLRIDWILAGVLAVGAGAAAADASDPPLSCPATIVPPESTRAPEGWRAWRVSEISGFRLIDVSFSDGPPEERVFLNAITARVVRGHRVETFDFTSEAFRAIWVMCQYSGTDIALVRETNIRGKRCRLTYPGPKAHQGRAPSVQCE